MNALVPIVMIGWLPTVIVLFKALSSRRAVIVSYLFAWLFLPVATLDVPGLPDYSKMTATSLGVLIGTLLFDSNRLKRFRLQWFDLPVIVLALSPFATAISNGLGVYEGLSAALEKVVRFCFPYLIGRCYLDSVEAFRELAIAVFVGGVLYVPICVWEARMSPTLHSDIYGFRASSMAKGIRYGGFRPLGFMWTYLALVAWMSISFTIGFWLWRTKTVRKLMGIPMPIYLAGIGGALVLCKTLTAILLVPVGCLIPMFVSRFRMRGAFIALALCVPAFIGVRATGMWDGYSMVHALESFDEERAHSLEVRIVNENRLAEHALKRPVFGWGRWGRSRIYDEDTNEDITRQDGLWIVTLGVQGLVGLVSVCLLFLIPIVRFARRFPPRQWRDPALAPTAALAVAVLLTFINNIPNTTLNPIITFAIGGLISLTTLTRPRWE